jgi:moderate conductance mechanosensitive channel
VIDVAILAVTDAQQTSTCGPPSDANWLCTQTLRVTGSERAAEVADALAVPIRIAFVLLVAWIVTRILHRAIARTVTRVRDQGSLSLLGASARLPMSEAAKLRRAQRSATISSVLRNAVSIIVWSIATLIVLGEIGISLGPIIASAGIAGVALAFGTQSIVRDYLTGLFIVLEDQYGVGDQIDTGVATGTVEWVSLRMTRLRDADGVAWHVPNGEIKRVANFSQRLPSEGQHDATRDRDLEDDSGAAAADEGPNPQDEGRRGDR